MKIIIDTNFLLVPFNFKIDIFSEINRICDFSYTLHIIDKTKDELDHIIKNQSGKHKDAAKFAKLLIKKTKIIKTNKDKDVDTLIMLNQPTIVATQDRALIQKLRLISLGIITVRQKSYLTLTKFRYIYK